MDQIRRRENMLPYLADEAVMNQMAEARRLTQQLNTADRSDYKTLMEITANLLGKGEGAFINPPFYCDYGFNIEVGRNFFANYNCTILDVAKVKIGNDCQFAPNVSIYTAGHPVHPETRKSGYEFGMPVTIGDNCWLGGGTIVCPGVTIGDNVVIGAGSVVTKDVPSNVIAAGNPCRVIRKITDEDKKYYYKNLEFDDEGWAAAVARNPKLEE